MDMLPVLSNMCVGSPRVCVAKDRERFCHNGDAMQSFFAGVLMMHGKCTDFMVEH